MLDSGIENISSGCMTPVSRDKSRRRYDSIVGKAVKDLDINHQSLSP
jgi:hypothetical protein